MANEEEKTCVICNQTSGTSSDVILFGDWMRSHNITVHYYCLLLSTNLPQRGHDNNGILGFLIRDIRREIYEASKRRCIYCNAMNASISCHTCKEYFHLICGYLNYCLFQFSGEFHSYCNECVPLDEHQIKLTANEPDPKTACHICMGEMGVYTPIRWIYGTCCGNGYAHSVCIQKYALNAGYYLKCIWCKNKSFRDKVRAYGIFVPDRDANWELERGAFRDLHRGHQRCDMEQCFCPRGRDYIQGPKWKLINCSLCGSFGAHNPSCIPGMQRSKERVKVFKCDTCSVIEQTIVEQNTAQASDRPQAAPKQDDEINTSLYVTKVGPDVAAVNMHETPEFSEDESSCSAITVIPSQRSVAGSTSNSPLVELSSTPTNPTAASKIVTSAIITLPSFTKDQSKDESRAPVPLFTSTQNASLTATPPAEPVHKNNWITLEMYEFKDNFDCIGKCLAKIDQSSPRFAGKTLAEIRNSTDLIGQDDIVERSSDRGLFTEIDRIIDEYLE